MSREGENYEDSIELASLKWTDTIISAKLDEILSPQESGSENWKHIHLGEAWVSSLS